MTYNPPNLRDVAALKALLLAELPRLVNCLFSGRNIQQTSYETRIGTNGSISIRLSDGSYFNHERGEGGDLLTMIAHTLKTDFKGAVVFAQNFVWGAPMPPVPPSHTPPKRNHVCKRDKALAMLKRSIPIKGTLAEAYLRNKRGITAEQPSVLRFNAHAYNYTAGGYYPTMIAPIHNVRGEVIAAHCTFIDTTTGNKLIGKNIKPRLIFGSCRGGAIRLSPLKNKVIVCEGIEDGLSLLQSKPDACVWVSAGTSGMVNIQLPDCVTDVVIAMDNDAEGAGQRAASILATRLKKEGRVARIATPAPFKDFNELLVQGNIACLTA